MATFLIDIFSAKCAVTIFYRRASEYVFISFDYKMIFHCYLLYRITAVTAVLQPIAGRLSTLGSVHEQVK
jgi:hypothetical protein